MHALMPLLLVLAAQPAPPQKSGETFKSGSHAFLLEAGNDSVAVAAFEGSAQRAVVTPTSASGGASGIAKTPPVVSTSAVLPLVPGAGLRTILEQAFVGGSAGNWLVRELDFQGQEVFVHQLEGVRLRSLELTSCDVRSKEPPTWSTTFEVGLVRLSAGSQGKVTPKDKTKAVRAGGLRVIHEGKELAQVLSIEGLHFDFPASTGSSSSRMTAPATLPEVLRVRLAGNDVKPWIDRLGSATSGLEIELLDASQAKPTVAARVTFENAQLIAVARPCDQDANAIDLEYRCVGPRLKF